LNAVKTGGKFLAATGGTDNHDTSYPYENDGEPSGVSSVKDYSELYAGSGKYSGVPTTYVNVRGELNQENILRGIREGHSFISNGVVVLADIDGAVYGDTAKVNEGTANINIEAFSREGLEAIHIVKNGKVIKEISLNEQPGFDDTAELSGLVPGDWIVLEVFGTDCRYAITNPIFIG
jgi:hypothetical protein